MSGKNNIVSVIVPIYNHEKYLEQCVNSLINQSYKYLEIVLVDDGSTDNSRKICDFYAQKDSRIKVIHKRNGGLVSARKCGLRESSGDFITTVDSDDWVEECMIERMMEQQKHSEADIVLCGIIIEYKDRKEYVPEKLKEKLYYLEDVNCPVYDKFFADNKSGDWGMRANIYSRLYKRHIIYDNQMLVDERINNGEDDACFFPTMLSAKKIYVMKDCMYHFRRSQEISMSRDGGTFSLLEVHLLQQRLEKCVKGHLCEHKLRNQLGEYIFLRIQHYLDNALGIHKKPIYILPYDIIEKHSRVLVYGAGNVGKCYISQLKNSDYCRLVGWIDKDEQRQGQCLGEIVCGLNKIKEIEYDYILLATTKETIAFDMKAELGRFENDLRKLLWKKPEVFCFGYFTYR